MSLFSGAKVGGGTREEKGSHTYESSCIAWRRNGQVRREG